MLDVLLEYHTLLFQGFFTTLKLLGSIILVGIPLGVLVGIIGARYSKGVSIIIRGLKFMTKVIPVLVFLFWLHFPLQAMLGVVIDPFWTTVAALGFINLIATAYIVDTELGLLPRSYRDAGLTLGLSTRQVVWYIELPIMIRRVAPSVALNQAAMLEYTLFASLIAVPELFRVAQTINSITYDPIAVYSLLVFFFLIILIPLHLFITYINKRFKTDYV